MNRSTKKTRKTLYLLTSMFLALALVLGACGDDDDVVDTPNTEVVEGDADADIIEEDVDDDTVGTEAETDGEVDVDVDVDADAETETDEEAEIDVTDGDTADEMMGTGVGMVGTNQPTILASSLLDMDFVNSDGGVTGEIEDVLIDTSTGNVLLASIEYGGFLDIGDTEISMPLNAFEWMDTGAVLAFDEAALESFPDQGDDWPNTENAGWDDELSTYWTDLGVTPGFNFTDASNSVMWLSDLTDYEFTGFGDFDSEVEDVVVNLNSGKVEFVIVEGDFGFGDNRYAVPLSALNLQRAEGVWMDAPDFDVDMFEMAPVWDDAAYAVEGFVDRAYYEATHPFWADMGYDN